MLFRPLFWTSFMLADWLVDNDCDGRRAASCCPRRRARPPTAPPSSSTAAAARSSASPHRGNRRLHREPRLLRRGAAPTTPSTQLSPTVADRSTPTWPASPPLTAALRAHLGDALVHDGRRRRSPTRTPRRPARSPTPGRRCSSRRTRCASASATGAGTGWTSGSPRPGGRFAPVVEHWVDVVVGHGPEALERVWHEVLSGRADPRSGHVLAL